MYGTNIRCCARIGTGLLAVSVVAIATCTASIADSFKFPSGVDVMSEEDIQQRIVGSTLSGNNKGTAWSETYLPFGTIVGTWGSKTYIGAWELSGSVLCLDYQGSNSDSCVALSIDERTVTFWKDDGAKKGLAKLAEADSIGATGDGSGADLTGEWIFDGEDAKYTNNKPAIVVFRKGSQLFGYWANLFEAGRTRCDRGLKWFAGRLEGGTALRGDRWTCGGKRYSLDGTLLDDGRVKIMVRTGSGKRVPTWLIRYETWLASQ